MNCKKCGRAIRNNKYDYCQTNAECKAAYMREFNRQYYEEHRNQELERCREYRKQYYAENREADLKRLRRWRKANPEKARDHNRKYRANKANAITGPLPADLTGYLGDLYGWRCQICDKELTRETLTVDHVVPLSVFPMHVLFNLQPACKSCNSGKCASLNHLDDRELSLIAMLKAG